MQSEVPKKYWENLPEAPLIADLIAASGRLEKMLRTESSPAKPAPRNAYLDSLRDLNAPKLSRTTRRKPDERREETASA